MNDMNIFELLRSESGVRNGGTEPGARRSNDTNGVDAPLPGKTDTYAVRIRPAISEFITKNTPHLDEFIGLLQKNQEASEARGQPIEPKIVDGHELVTIDLGKCLHASHNVQNHWHVQHIGEVNVSVRVPVYAILAWLQSIIFITNPKFKLTGMPVLDMRMDEFKVFLNGCIDTFAVLMNEQIDNLTTNDDENATAPSTSGARTVHTVDNDSDDAAEEDSGDNNRNDNSDDDDDDTIPGASSCGGGGGSSNVGGGRPYTKQNVNGGGEYVDGDDNEDNSLHGIGENLCMLGKQIDALTSSLESQQQQQQQQQQQKPQTPHKSDQSQQRGQRRKQQKRPNAPDTDANVTASTAIREKSTRSSSGVGREDTATPSSASGTMTSDAHRLVSEYWRAGTVLKNFGAQVCDNIGHLQQINRLYVEYGKSEESREFLTQVTRTYVEFLRLRQPTITDFANLAQMLFGKFLMYETSVSILSSLIFSIFQTMLLMLSDQVIIGIESSSSPASSSASASTNGSSLPTSITNTFGRNDIGTGAGTKDLGGPFGKRTNNSSAGGGSGGGTNNTNSHTNAGPSGGDEQNITPMDIVTNIIGTRLKMYLLAPEDPAWVNFLHGIVIKSPAGTKTVADKKNDMVRRVYSKFRHEFEALGINHIAILLPTTSSDEELRRKTNERKTERAHNLFENDPKNGKLSALNQRIVRCYENDLPSSDYQLILHMAAPMLYLMHNNRFDMNLLQWTQKFSSISVVANANKHDGLGFSKIYKTLKLLATELVLTRYIDRNSFYHLIMNNKHINVLMSLVVQISKQAESEEFQQNAAASASSASSTHTKTDDKTNNARPHHTTSNASANGGHAPTNNNSLAAQLLGTADRHHHNGHQQQHKPAAMVKRIRKIVN